MLAFLILQIYSCVVSLRFMTVTTQGAPMFELQSILN